MLYLTLYNNVDKRLMWNQEVFQRPVSKQSYNLAPYSNNNTSIVTSHHAKLDDLRLKNYSKRNLIMCRPVLAMPSRLESFSQTVDEAAIKESTQDFTLKHKSLAPEFRSVNLYANLRISL